MMDAEDDIEKKATNTETTTESVTTFQEQVAKLFATVHISTP